MPKENPLKWIEELQREANDLHIKEFGFQGLDHHFSSIQDKMMIDFMSSKSFKHPGDMGTVREDFLRLFLQDQGYLPEKYGVSDGSSIVISQTGHKSEQIDLLIYDKANSPKLIDLKNVQYFAVESVFGAVQIKSSISSKKHLLGALSNIASFKKLKKSLHNPVNIGGAIEYTEPISPGFGVLFAYRSKLKWKTLTDTIEDFQKNNPSSIWPNIVVILDQGIILQTDGSKSVFKSEEICKLTKTNLNIILANKFSLLSFYLILIDLLNSIKLTPPNMRRYTDLPIPIGDHYYKFGQGGFRSTGNCKKHGMYLRKLSQSSIETIIDFCKNVEPINWLDAMTEMYDGFTASGKNYERQSYLIKIYNPENIPLSNLLSSSEIGLIYDEIMINGEIYWIPFYYSIRDNLISECTKCNKDK